MIKHSSAGMLDHSRYLSWFCPVPQAAEHGRENDFLPGFQVSTAHDKHDVFLIFSLSNYLSGKFSRTDSEVFLLAFNNTR